ncbi:GD10474 [Drosophila simulans]|uniref:GD10474 n=1 Tax=Drosophila simulans TaxID=7240 RepID=B4QE92_DROSI|nr:GD10474 [Drosophila simulans]
MNEKFPLLLFMICLLRAQPSWTLDYLKLKKLTADLVNAIAEANSGRKYGTEWVPSLGQALEEKWSFSARGLPHTVPLPDKKETIADATATTTSTTTTNNSVVSIKGTRYNYNYNYNYNRRPIYAPVSPLGWPGVPRWFLLSLVLYAALPHDLSTTLLLSVQIATLRSQMRPARLLSTLQGTGLYAPTDLLATLLSESLHFTLVYSRKPGQDGKLPASLLSTAHELPEALLPEDLQAATGQIDFRVRSVSLA